MEDKRKAILLVEDEAILALAEKQRLEDKGYHVYHVSTGEKAVKTVLEEPFPIDLVLMDINLGKGIDGTEAARRILEHKDIPVVFLSSHTEPEVVEKTEKITSYGYVVKNSGVVVLDTSIKMALKLFSARMERKKMELEAKKRENFLNKVFEILPIGLWFADEKGTLRQGNPAGIKIWGAEPKVPIEEYGVFKARRIPSGEELAPEEWALAHTVNERVTIADELLEIEAFDGEKRIILNYTAPVIGDDGNLLGAVIVNNDVTEKYRAEEELRESEARNRENAALLDTSQELVHIGSWEWDVEKQSMKWTNEAYRIHGMEPGELPAGSPGHIRRSVSCYDPADQLLIEEAFRRCADEGVPYDLEFPLNRIDGERIWIRTMAYALWEGDRIVKVIGIIMDITRQKQAEAVLQNERRRLAGILEGTNVGTWEWNVQTGETIFNERWADILGYTLAEISPVSIKTWDRFIYPGDQASRAVLLEKHFQREAPFYECECRMKHRDGRWVWVLERGKVVSRTEDDRPLLVMGTHLDINNRKLTEQNHLLLSSAASELQALGPEAMDYNRIADMARNLSAAAAALNDARSRFQSMQVLYDQLYQGESYEGGSVVDYLEALVPQVVDLFPAASKVRVLVSPGPEYESSPEHCILEAGNLSIAGLMVNELVTNAMKYAFAERGGTLRVAIHCSERSVEISVADDGPGMPESFDLHNPAGFGLTMVRTLAGQLEGSVSFTSREKRGDEGTEVIIRFPRGERYEK